MTTAENSRHVLSPPEESRMCCKCKRKCMQSEAHVRAPTREESVLGGEAKQAEQAKLEAAPNALLSQPARELIWQREDWAPKNKSDFMHESATTRYITIHERLGREIGRRFPHRASSWRIPIHNNFPRRSPPNPCFLHRAACSLA